MTDFKHCPGFEKFRQLDSFVCRCPECGAELELFSDELDRPQTCGKCRAPLDSQRCAWHAGVGRKATAGQEE